MLLFNPAIRQRLKPVYAIFFILLTVTAINADSKVILKMATTTSTENSGLLNYLLPEFENESGIQIHAIAVGTGKALKLGENGDVDVLFVHAKDAELDFVAKGFGVDRREVMYNDFIITGSKKDLARLAGAENVVAAFSLIAKTGTAFVSRGDESGTHKKELEIWKNAGIKPEGAWYLEAGQGMEAVLMMASEKQAYTLTDRGTYIAVLDKIELVILFEGDAGLFNQYGVIAVNPAKHPHVKYADAEKFIDWITSEKGQALIAGFKLKDRQMFFPNALTCGKNE